MDKEKLLKAFNIVLKKLLEAKPELEEWAKKNFEEYIIKDD
jgi:hypothetical protein